VRYLIIPKIDEAAREIAAEGGLRPAIRAHVLERLRQQRLTDRIRVSVRDAVEREANRRLGRLRQKIRIVASPDRHTVTTGITVIEADQVGASNIGKDLSDALVVPDAPLELIAPHTPEMDTVAAGPTGPPEETLWHLRDIGLTSARKAGFEGTGLGVTAAVLDTGIADVPELTGRVIDTRELDLETWQARKLDRTKDTHGHGTLVAGLIAGRTVGVAPGASLVNVMMVPAGIARSAATYSRSNGWHRSHMSRSSTSRLDKGGSDPTCAS
jgi:subtilisin family serine protease